MTAAHCANCGTELRGDYCHGCGQERADPSEHPLGDFLHQFAYEVAQLDFATLRSLRALVSPGSLTVEYLAGRRRPYLRPLRLYLLCAAIFFLAAPYATDFHWQALTAQDETGGLAALGAERMKIKGLDEARFAERFDLRFQTVYTFGLAVSVVASALLLALLFRGRRTVIAHVIFALHYVSFLYLVALLVGAISRLLGTPHPLVVFAMAYTLIVPYLFVALRRVYGEPAGRTLMKTAVLIAITFIVDTMVNLGAVLLTLQLV